MNGKSAMPQQHHIKVYWSNKKGNSEKATIILTF